MRSEFSWVEGFLLIEISLGLNELLGRSFAKMHDDVARWPDDPHLIKSSFPSIDSVGLIPLSISPLPDDEPAFSVPTERLPQYTPVELYTSVILGVATSGRGMTAVDIEEFIFELTNRLRSDLFRLPDDL